MTPSPSRGDILRRVVIGLSRGSDEPLRAAAIGSAVSCGFRETHALVSITGRCAPVHLQNAWRKFAVSPAPVVSHH